jgi:hypothetical protein
MTSGSLQAHLYAIPFRAEYVPILFLSEPLL